ncbi:MAG: hypothetical protein KKE20_05380 [Nanoarchaeota archaeon]|nr:hypothetical protein [Nanoarchaeota archaeon]
MKKSYLWVIIVIMASLLSIQSVLAVPAWKTQPTTPTTSPTTPITTAAPTSNVPPQITSISLEPDPVNFDGKIKCSVTPFDANGDTVTITYQWTSTGRCNLSKIQGNVVDLSTSECESDGDVITCVATPSDSKVKGIASQDSVIIESKSINWEMIGVILVILGGLVTWFISRLVRGKTAKYMTDIDGAYNKYRMNTNKCEAELTHLREKIESDFKNGKLNDQGLAILEKRIEKYSRELRSSIIDGRFELPNDLHGSIKKMLADGVITKDEYAHFKDALKKTSLGSSDKAELKKLMKRWKESDKK